jgi:hypothetical protein
VGATSLILGMKTLRSEMKRAVSNPIVTCFYYKHTYLNLIFLNIKSFLETLLKSYLVNKLTSQNLDALELALNWN